jgi:hypothetical protein
MRYAAMKKQPAGLIRQLKPSSFLSVFQFATPRCLCCVQAVHSPFPFFIYYV